MRRDEREEGDSEMRGRDGVRRQKRGSYRVRGESMEKRRREKRQ